MTVRADPRERGAGTIRHKGKKLKDILEAHEKFHKGHAGGERADLSGADLSRADLKKRDLTGANLAGSNLRKADLRGAKLSHADLSRADMRQVLNDKVKRREAFRPFAPAVLLERAGEFFELDQPEPFMTLAPRVRAERRQAIAAAVHVDGTARVQTVARADNPRYYDLIEEFGRLTGVPVLLNTSFNRREPIVARPEEAIACFLRSGIDVLVLGDFYINDRGTEQTDNAAPVERSWAPALASKPTP